MKGKEQKCCKCGKSECHLAAICFTSTLDNQPRNVWYCYEHLEELAGDYSYEHQARDYIKSFLRERA